MEAGGRRCRAPHDYRAANAARGPAGVRCWKPQKFLAAMGIATSTTSRPNSPTSAASDHGYKSLHSARFVAGRFVDEHLPGAKVCCFVGGTGTGKTHLAGRGASQTRTRQRGPLPLLWFSRADAPDSAILTIRPCRRPSWTAVEAGLRHPRCCCSTTSDLAAMTEWQRDTVGYIPRTNAIPTSRPPSRPPVWQTSRAQVADTGEPSTGRSRTLSTKHVP